MPNFRTMVRPMLVLITAALGGSLPGYAAPQNNPRPAPPACASSPTGTKATVTDTADGAAIVLTGAGDPSNIRTYAQRTAQMYNHMVSMQSGMPMTGSGGMGMRGNAMRGGMMGMHGGAPIPLVPSHASAENTASGARIVLVPEDAAQRTALRDQARRQASMIEKGQCPLRQPAAG